MEADNIEEYLLTFNSGIYADRTKKVYILNNISYSDNFSDGTEGKYYNSSIKIEGLNRDVINNNNFDISYNFIRLLNTDISGLSLSFNNSNDRLTLSGTPIFLTVAPSKILKIEYIYFTYNNDIIYSLDVRNFQITFKPSDKIEILAQDEYYGNSNTTNLFNIKYYSLSNTQIKIWTFFYNI